jgi:type II secretory pathway pseudopilin PulG
VHVRRTSVAQHQARGGEVFIRARGRRGGFTVIDVLVTMAVIAVLISLLSPSLTSIRESARQIVCRSDVRQIGIGISMFAETHRDRVPYTVNMPTSSGGQPWETMDLRLDATGPDPGLWDGLGYLVKDELVEPAKVYYCPSHHGHHPYPDYSSAWAGRNDAIVGNFQYRPWGPGRRPSASNAMPNPTNKLSQMYPSIALVADGMRTQEDFNHRIGANVLRAGLSVEWWRDQSGRLSDGLPKDGQAPSSQSIGDAWHWLDDPS